MKFSIAMCTYNGAAYVKEQLESIAAQTRMPYELVICDDCSSDNTQEIIEAFVADSLFPVSFYVNEVNLGPKKNFERAVERCTGEVIALSDQDDIWHPEKLERIEAILHSAPSVGLVFTDAELVDENLRPTGYRLWQTLTRHQQRSIRNRRVLEALLHRNFVTGATMAFRSELREVMLPIPSYTKLLHDGWFALVGAATTDIAFIAQPLIKYRRHPGQAIGISLPGSRTTPVSTTDKPSNETLVEALHKMARFYRDEAKDLNSVRQLLIDAQNRYDVTRAIPVLETEIARLTKQAKHFTTRAGMPTNKFKRLTYIMKELVTLHYHYYSRGFLSAARDLLS